MSLKAGLPLCQVEASEGEIRGRAEGGAGGRGEVAGPAEAAGGVRDGAEPTAIGAKAEGARH